jgi:hypothetical protein
MEAQANFTLSDLKPAQPITGWEDFLADGSGYLNTAIGALVKQREVFTPQILYNLIAMAIEKFVMAALMRYGAMPYNHTMADLVEAMEETFPGSVVDIRDELLLLDGYQEICDLEGFSIAPPGMEKIPAMLDMAGRVKNIVTEKILPNES